MNTNNSSAMGLRVLLLFLFTTPAAAQSTSSELATEIISALDTACSVLEFGRTVNQKYVSFGQALGDVPTGLGGNSNALGSAGERTIRDLLDQSGISYEEQTRFSDVASRRERRGDFVIRGSSRSRVYIEVKNKARITTRDVTQIRDYGRGGGHTIVAVRPGAKISRSAARPLFARWNAGLITIVQCAFSL